MVPATGSDAQDVLDAVAAGEPIPAGFAFDGVTAYALEQSDVDRIEEGGTVEAPPDPAALNPGPVPEAPAEEPV